MGARVKFSTRSNNRFRSVGPFSLDVNSDKNGEHFTIRQREDADVEFQVLDVDKDDRHLLLLVRDQDEKTKQKYLCGHDERHWFVAAIPEAAPVGTIRQAKEALKPPEVVERQTRKGLKTRKKNSRKNEAFVRQGEWFFLPVTINVDEKLIIHDEPITRDSRSKPHIVQDCVRLNGEVVYVNRANPNGISVAKWKKITEDPNCPDNLSAKFGGWRQMMRDAQVYVRGYVKHSDHATIYLNGWHRVVMNTENKAAAMRHVAFLD
jgi:hypothetical protein